MDYLVIDKTLLTEEALKDMFNELIYDLDGQLETLDINNYLY